MLLDAARQAGHTIAVAESCTGGLLGGRLTSVAGSSDVFVGGVIAYADAVKTELLGVSPELLETHGAVSAEVAEAMVRGVVARTGADVAISITGVAGPGGGSSEKPIGTVWFGVWHGGTVESVRVGFPGTRPEIRARAVVAAMFGLLRRIDPSRRRQPPGVWGGTTV